MNILKLKNLPDMFLPVLCILLSGTIFCGWGISINNFFLFDDYQWQWLTHHTSYKNLFNIIPTMPYNDRPVGAVVIKGLFDCFGMNHILHHTFLLALHLFNSLLFFFLLRRILKDYLKQYDKQSCFQNIPWISAVFFAGWTTSTIRSVTWDAAIFDLLGCNFTLMSTYSYFAAQKGRHRLLFAIACIIFYYLALRSKEMTIALPVMLGFISAWNYYFLKKNNELLKFNKLLLSALVLVMIFYIARIAWVKHLNHFLEDPASPYYISFSPIIVFRNLYRYIKIFFNPYQNDYSMNPFMGSISSNLMFFGIIILFYFLSLRSFIKYRSPLFLLPTLFVLQIAPVLIMKNMQCRLYLYMPSMLLSIAVSCLISWILYTLFSRIKYIHNRRWVIQALLIITCFSVLFFESVLGVNPKMRNFYLQIGFQNRKMYKSLENLPIPCSGSIINIIDMPAWLSSVSMFSKGSGEGDVLKTYYNDASLSSKVLLTPLQHDSEVDNHNQAIWKYQNDSIVTQNLLNK